MPRAGCRALPLSGIHVGYRGQDIEAHANDITTLIGKVRLFLNAAKRGEPLASGPALAQDYERFREALPGLCADLDIDANALTFKDFVWMAARWVGE